MLLLPAKATQPTLYFIGVTTGQSSIMEIFPLWADALGLKDVCIKGIDLGIHAPVEEYRAGVQFIKDDPLAMGALVTTHKIDIYNAAKDMFDYLDPYAEMFEELSCISKQNEQLRGHAKDPISAGLSLDAFIPANHWSKTKGEVAILGAGGAALAISAYLAQEKPDNLPARIHLTNRSAFRLSEAVKILSTLPVLLSFHLCPTPDLNDTVIRSLPEGSLVVNATGLGKDRPGSPLTDCCPFPENGIVWEINYRGSLEFMHQAINQRLEKNLSIEDGWIYFIHGWTQVIAEVFHIDITDEKFKACEKIALKMRGTR